MIENLIHTVSKENKPSQNGFLQATHSKNETGLEGQFRTLFQSLKSESENPEDLLTEQDLVDETNESELKMDESPASMNRNDGGSEALKNVEKEESVDQNRASQKTESAPEKSDLVKSTMHDESIAETEMSRTKVEGGASEIKEGNVSDSDDQKVLVTSDSDSIVERAEIQYLSKDDTQTNSENNQYESAPSFIDADSAHEYSRSEEPAVDNIHRKSPSEFKESSSDSVLRKESSSDSVLRVDRSRFDKTETNSKVDANESRSASKVQVENETQSTNESAETISFGDDKPDQASRVENSILKQEPSAGHIEKGEPQVLKSESNEFQRFINVDEGSNTIPKSEEGGGTASQPERPFNKLNYAVETKETVSSSDEMKQFSSNENNSSTDLRSSEVYTQKSEDGEFTRGKVQPTERDLKSAQPITTLNSSAIRQNSDSAERFIDRFINENSEKPIRITQKLAESTVLIQDKVHPKRERNEVSFLNNIESKGSSRLTIPGIGVDATNQSASFSSGQFSDSYNDLSESEKNEILWKEYNAEMDKSDELNKSELSASALAKLGDSTLSNHFLRRVLLPGLTQTVFTASGQADRAENWQRHNFILEDGSKVQLSARKVDGVLQIKLGASIGELSKLLQIHQNEIREHLEKECNIKIDLQFEQGSGDQDQSSLDNFFGESTKHPVLDAGNEAENQAKKSIKKQLHTVATRNFGYNSKEWTA